MLAVQPHAHNLARRMEAKAALPDGTTRWLIAIDDWDFRWQDVYRYAEPFVLPKGTTISMRYTYDNSADNPRNPHRPPARVVWGQNTSDEMGDFWIQVIPRSERRRRDPERGFPPEGARGRSRGLHEAAAGRPGQPASARRGRDPLSGRWAARRRHRRVSPVAAAERRVGADPLQPRLRAVDRGRRDEAIAQFQEALRIDPDYAQAHNNLGALLQLIGQPDQAMDHYRRAVALRPDNIEARANLGQLLSNQGEVSEAADQFRATLALRAEHPQALAGLAWIRATASDPALRDAGEAVRLGERAAAATRNRDVVALDALGAAYASAERYEDAIRVARTGLDLAVSAGQMTVAAQFRQRLELYRTTSARADAEAVRGLTRDQKIRRFGLNNRP